MSEATYALGHSSAEIQRLANQGAMLRPITERLLRNAGIDAGMRVLDLGCGVGDVSMLAAELVGPAGSVVGIDRSQEVLNMAKERAQDAGLRAGDVIVGVGNQRVGSLADASKAIAAAVGGKGHAVALRVLRDGAIAFVGVTVDPSAG